MPLLKADALRLEDLGDLQARLRGTVDILNRFMQGAARAVNGELRLGQNVAAFVSGPLSVKGGEASSFVATTDAWRPGLVLASATLGAAGDTQTVLPVWRPETSGGRAGVRLVSLPGLTADADYKVVLVVFPL